MGFNELSKTIATSQMALSCSASPPAEGKLRRRAGGGVRAEVSRAPPLPKQFDSGNCAVRCCIKGGAQSKRLRGKRAYRKVLA